ncbi:hypothetical protein [Dolosigranulum pigrum]|nr:hypothetical protein [Dolosigranulum pigrum]
MIKLQTIKSAEFYNKQKHKRKEHKQGVKAETIQAIDDRQS